MRYGYLLAVMAATVLGGCAQPESLVMRPAVSPEGWNGNAFYRNNIIASEEFSSGKNGVAVDVWRFYDGYGRLYTEERDTNGDGVRDLYRAFNKDGELALQKEDTNGDGVYDRTTDFTKKRLNDTQPKVKDVNDPVKIEKAGTRKFRTQKKENTVKSRPAKTHAAKPARRSLEESRVAEIPVAAPAEPVYIEPTPAAPAPQAQPQTPPPSRENFIRPVPMPTGGLNGGASVDSRVVPGPVFHHPSDGLED